MPIPTENVPNLRRLRHGLIVSAVSIVWTVVTSVTLVLIGLSHHSIVLIAFGLTGLLDAAGSTALVVHFRHGMKHEVFSEAHERIAFRIVTIGLGTVAIATFAGSVHRLIVGGQSEESLTGLVIAAMSAVVLSVLALTKRRVGSAIPSGALCADGLLSATGALLAMVTLVGSVLSDRGLGWADPVAAMLVAIGAIIVVLILNRGEREQ